MSTADEQPDDGVGAIPYGTPLRCASCGATFALTPGPRILCPRCATDLERMR